MTPWIRRALGVLAGLTFSGLVLTGAAVAEPDAARADAPPAPDYASARAWAATPDAPGGAGFRPAGERRAHRGTVPVFFIHPTTDLSLTIGNAPYDAGGETGRRVDELVMTLQASAFNAAGRVWAPRYRQASLKAITTDSPEGYAADEIAYGDVARAFDAFIGRIGDRPFILAGHSQGSIHALRLLQDRIIGTPLQKRLVAAYLPGLSLPKAIAGRGLPVCASPRTTGCVVSWNTVRSGVRDAHRMTGAIIWWDGRYQPIAGRPIVCVNPLTWRTDGAAPESADLGAIRRPKLGDGPPVIEPAAAGAACEDQLLGVSLSPENRLKFSDPLTTLRGVYHDFDIGLFWENIRENAVDRAAAWRKPG